MYMYHMGLDEINIRLHQLCWGDQEWVYYKMCLDMYVHVEYMANCLLKEALHVMDLNSGWSFPSSHIHCGLALRGRQRSGDYVETAIKTYMCT